MGAGTRPRPPIRGPGHRSIGSIDLSPQAVASGKR
jgi:hypothetical protein